MSEQSTRIVGTDNQGDFRETSKLGALPPRPTSGRRAGSHVAKRVGGRLYFILFTSVSPTTFLESRATTFRCCWCRVLLLLLTFCTRIKHSRLSIQTPNTCTLSRRGPVRFMESMAPLLASRSVMLELERTLANSRAGAKPRWRGWMNFDELSVPIHPSSPKFTKVLLP